MLDCFTYTLNLVVQSICVVCRKPLLWKQLLTVLPASEKSVERVAFNSLLIVFLTLRQLHKRLGTRRAQAENGLNVHIDITCLLYNTALSIKKHLK